MLNYYIQKIPLYAQSLIWYCNCSGWLPDTTCSNTNGDNNLYNDVNAYAHPSCNTNSNTNEVEDLGNVGIATSFFIVARVPG